MSIWLDILCLMLLILLNGFFAMSEISIVTARRSKLQMLADQGASGAELALSLSENPTRALYTIQVGITSIGILSGIAVHFLRDPFIGLYGASDAAVAYAREFINVISVTIIGTCYQAACLFGLVKSGGDISFVFRNDTIFVFLVVLPSAIIASYLGAPPWVVFACLKCDQILKCFVAVVKINRYNWMKNLTRETNEV